MERITSFEPIVGENPKLLILGTMPSVKSLEANEYYGFGRNQFWRIMGDLFGFDRDDDYQLRKQKMREHHIVVWDVLQSCLRKGSLDKDIKEEDYNDIVGFVQEHPTIRRVILNGGKARDVYKKQFAHQLPELEWMVFYSTSPANAITYDRKMEQWKQILEWI